MKKLTGIVIGAGMRGAGYCNLMKEAPEKFQIVGVAEPIKERNEKVKKWFDVSEENCYESWEQILDRPKFADFAIIATQDAMHFEPAMKALELGYDLLLEKPMAPTPEECRLIAEQAEKYGRKVVVCHVLRYTKLFKAVKNILLSGRIGEVVSVEWLESVGNKHQSHSFVRGHWRNKEESSEMILAKSCHDLDAIQWLIGKECKRVGSFGSLSFFRKENKPEGAPERCIEGCPHAENCPYDTAKLYQGPNAMGGSWFRNVATEMDNPTEEDVANALRTTNYGRCVFDCDNNVVDHQVVNMEFDGGATVSFTMTGLTPDGAGRIFKLFCTKGMLQVSSKNDIISITEFEKHKSGFRNLVTEEIDVSRMEDANGIGIASGHGGGDGGIVEAIYEEFNNAYTGFSISTARTSYLNHLLSFAAEVSRLESRVINIDEFAKQH